MHLSKPDLFQMNDKWLKKLPAEQLLGLSKRLLHGAKELQQQLNQNPENSSRPPTSQAPWAKTGGSEEQSGAADERGTANGAAETAGSSTDETEQAPPVDSQRSSTGKGSGKRPGKRPGCAGQDHSQKMAITAPCEHRPELCAACAAASSADAGDAPSQAYPAWDEVDMVPPEGLSGLPFTVTRHTLLEVICSCDHVSRAQPWRAPADGQSEKVELGEWRLVGPRLTGVIVLLAPRMHLSRASIREPLMEAVELPVSTGVIDEVIRQAGRASRPLEDALVAVIVQAAQLHVEETSRPESGILAWRWTTHTALSLIGPRSREMLENALRDGFPGLLISDSYGVYRALENRLRCWPHLPLSNSVAEQALRLWVISRYISHGTRSEEGSRAFAFLASLIETCRRRGASAWQYLGTVIAAARKGLQLPTIPAIPAAV